VDVQLSSQVQLHASKARDLPFPRSRSLGLG